MYKYFKVFVWIIISFFYLNSLTVSFAEEKIKIGLLIPMTGKDKDIGQVIGIDLQEVEPIPGVQLHQLDFLSNDADIKIKDILGGKASVVISDMAAPSSGHK